MLELSLFSGFIILTLQPLVENDRFNYFNVRPEG